MFFSKPFKLGVCNRLDFSPDGKFLATLSQHVSFWDMTTGKRLAQVRPLSHCSRIVFAPCGRKLAVTNTSGHTVVLSIPDGKAIIDLKNALGAGKDGADPAFSNCGAYLVAGSWGGRLLVREIETGRLIFEEGFDRELITQVSPMSIGANANWLVLHQPRFIPEEDIDLPTYITLHKWPFARGSFERIDLPDLCNVDKFALSPDGKLVAVVLCQIEDNLQILRLNDWSVCCKLTVDFATASQPLRWSPDGEWLALVRKAQVEFVASKDFALRIIRHFDKPTAVAIARNKNYLAFGSWGKDSCVVPWDAVFTDVA